MLFKKESVILTSDDTPGLATLLGHQKLIPQSSSSIMALADAQEGGLETDHSIATVRPGNTALGHNSHLHLGIISDG